ncbi:MAG TPA: DUF3592 domain-containing protein, partial [Pirellulales bacterium]|nr:DUF3592 domain-containing protein [Pirellulales bacterium]
MAKFPFRLYGKKRGDRRTGSQTLGNAGEALFFAFFFLLGMASLGWLLVRWVVPEWRVMHSFVPTSCRVVGKLLESEVGGQFLPQVSEEAFRYRPRIHIQYVVEGQAHETATYDIDGESFPTREEAQRILDGFVDGREYPCWYDPADPDSAVLVRGFTWWLWIVSLVPVSFLIIGGAGLIWALFQWGKSAEHRSVAVTRVSALNLLQANS